jgi:hypothetical protein
MGDQTYELKKIDTIDFEKMKDDFERLESL